MIRLAFLLLLSGCISTASAGSVTKDKVHWCVWVEMKDGEVARLCTQKRSTCEKAAKMGNKYGSAGGISKVDQCEYRNE